jgi:hypothetical protein
MFKILNQHKSYQLADPYAEAFSTYKVIQRGINMMSSLLDFISLICVVISICHYNLFFPILQMFM